MKGQLSPLQFGVSSEVPKEVAVCPECNSQLRSQSMAYEEATGMPLASAIEFDCIEDTDTEHRYWQSDWQPVRDAIAKWCRAISE